MLRYITVRVLQGFLVIFLISVITFVIMRLMPGDPTALLFGEGGVRVTEEQREAIREQWGLNQPYHEQYLIWVYNFVTGNFGQSLIHRGVPVRALILEAVPETAILNGFAIVIALLIAIPGGIIAAVRRNTWFDYGNTMFATLGISLPNFWLGLMLIVLFVVVLGGNFPLIGRIPPYGVRDWQGYILPIFVLALAEMAVLARVMRSSTIEVLDKDYVRTAKAKGLPQRIVLVRHAVRNALLPVITLIGYRIAFLLSGTIVVEYVFAIPGIGRLFTDSVFRLDYQVVQSLVVLLAVLVVVINLLTDLTYALIDPRIRYG